MRKILQTEAAPAPIGQYSQAVHANGMLYLSGQIGIDPQSGQLVKGAAQEVDQVFRNIQALLQTADVSMDDVVSLTVWLKDFSVMTWVNEAISRYFNSPFPARTSIQVSALPLNAQIEVTAVACYIPDPATNLPRHASSRGAG